MAKHIFGGMRRLTAVIACLVLLAAQLALPMAALAQDVSVLPAVTLGWTDANGAAMGMTVSASAYGDTFVYWAVVPAEAMPSLYIADIMGSDPAMTYSPAVRRTRRRWTACPLRRILRCTWTGICWRPALCTCPPRWICPHMRRNRSPRFPTLRR